MRNLLLLVLCWCAALPAAPADPLELTVHLQTEEKRQPLYLSLPAECPQAIRSALQFDLYHGGYFAPATLSEEASKTLATSMGKPEWWKAASKLGLAYVATLRKTPPGLWQLECTRIASRDTWKSEERALTGDPTEQRFLTHTWTDALHLAWFQRPPIATKRILYTWAKQSGGASEIWEADYDGQNRRKLISEAHVCLSPMYLPADRGHHPQGILYVSYRAGMPKLFMVPTLGEQPQRVSELAGNQFHPILSRQADRIAFISDAAGRPDLFIQPFCPKRGALGRARQLYTAPHSGQASPTWSPDGKKIAFVSDKDRAQRIYVLEIPPLETKIQEMRPVCISKVNAENTAPAWSPNGRYLAYCAKVAGTRQIWVYDFETGQERALSSGPHHKENPVWGADSLHLVYNTANATQSELYLANLNEPSAVRITEGPGIKRFPHWDDNSK